MKWIVNDLNIKKQADDLGISIWQTPSLLFLIMGIISIIVMIVVYFVSRNHTSPEYLILAETFVTVTIFVAGNMIITSVEKLTQINKMKSEFVAIVSHQLKNPLTGINWDIELLISKYKKGLDQKQLDIIKKINGSTILMTRLVNDLLDVVRIDQGNLFVNKDKFNIEGIIKKTIVKNESLTRQMNVEIRVEISDNTPQIVGDEKRLEVALDNLFSNAVKYNKEGGVVVIKVEKKNKEINLCVEDNGIGIPEKEQAQIFEKFYRSEKAIRKETGGTGLGLYIAKNIVEQCGGKIWFKSSEEKGSKFCFSLPLA